jgi:hypothetical protein
MLLSGEQVHKFQAHLQTAGVRSDCLVYTQPVDWARIAELVAVPTYLHSEQRTTPVRSVRCVCPHCAAVTTFDGAALDLQPSHEEVIAEALRGLDAAQAKMAQEEPSATPPSYTGIRMTLKGHDFLDALNNIEN